MKVIVCILAEDPHSDKVSKIKQLFNNSLFHTKIYKIGKPEDTDTKSHYKEQLKWCLNKNIHDYPGSYIFVIRDDVIFSIDSKTLTDVVREVIKYNNANNVSDIEDPINILYLSAWGDDCQYYEKEIDMPQYNMYFTRTKGPKGSSAFLLSPDYCKGIRDKECCKDNTNAFLLLPLPFIVDPSVDITKINLQKSKIVRHHNNFLKKRNENHDVKPVSIGWYIFIVIIFIVLIFFLTEYDHLLISEL